MLLWASVLLRGGECMSVFEKVPFCLELCLHA